VELVNCPTCEPIHVAQYDGDAFAGEFAIPLDVFSAVHAVFVKLEFSRFIVIYGGTTMSGTSK
jgi:hypothetical protein